MCIPCIFRPVIATVITIAVAGPLFSLSGQTPARADHPRRFWRRPKEKECSRRRHSTPLYRFEKGGILHKHPYGNTITTQRSNELFASITEEKVSTISLICRGREGWKMNSGCMTQQLSPVTQKPSGTYSMVATRSTTNSHSYIWLSSSGRNPTSRSITETLQAIFLIPKHYVICLKTWTFLVIRGSGWLWTGVFTVKTILTSCFKIM